ncbi:hypothetical protein LCGC14_1248730 [marine sediment metagenome]|uniref:Uncharacterized protein n=1 Tax=marine sediment metagenome TaxID=412755 RepID=A0A0F9NKZ8_9ZZZZ
MAREDVRERCLNILNTTPGLRLEDALNNIKDLTQARKDVVIRDKIVKDAVRDNSTMLESNKVLLKLNGALIGNDRHNTNIDNRSINFTLNSADVKELSIITSRLEALRDRRKITGDIVNKGNNKDNE